MNTKGGHSRPNELLERYQENVQRLFVKPDDGIGRCLHAAVGISGEGGEILDTVKKAWIYGAELDRENILEECGDVLFYVTALLDECGFNIALAMQHNMDKLAVRYPAGYTDLNARIRLDKEGEGL